MSGRVNLDRWGPHLLAAKREGMSLTQYARSRGLSRHTLYAARQTLRSKGGRSDVQRRLGAPQSGFATVKLLAPERPSSGGLAAQLRAQLPNGVKLELLSTDTALLAAAIEALAKR